MSGIEVGLAVAAVASTGMTAYGQIKGAQDQAQAMKDKAALEEVQAQELENREKINEVKMRQSEVQNELNFGSHAAYAGGGGTELGGMLTLHKQTEDAIAFAQRDAEFKAQMIRAGANIENKLASDTETAGYIGAAGTLLGAAGKAYSLYRGPGSPSSLPDPAKGT